MEKTEKTFRQIIDEAFSKINEFEGGNALFYERFHKTRSDVSKWKTGRVVPSNSDIVKFIKVSNTVIKDCTVARNRLMKEHSKLVNEFSNLITA